VYVHVPVCRSKCAYCDFFSLPEGAEGTSTEEVALRLLKQAEGWLRRGVSSQPLKTLYVGGGTPTMLGGALPFLVAGIVRAFGLRPGAEVTIEANPDSLDATLVGMLAEAGVTRVSLGVQSCADDELAGLGRPHDVSQALRAAQAVLEAGLELSVDLMCGIPGQTLESWNGSVDTVIALGCAHVSVYPLSLELGTPLAASVARGELAVPDEDAVAVMIEAASVALTKAGLLRYEIANFARPGHESVHNTAYWTGAEYLGVGPGAHGLLAGSSARAVGLIGASNYAQRVRYAVEADIGEGLEAVPPVELEFLSAAEALREDCMLGLRRVAGIAEELAERAGVTAVLAGCVEAGLVERSAGVWRLSERGLLLGNEVFGRVWTHDSGLR
jgi:oxygen-independent coproporphyrinogen-3 oxidase